MSAGESMRMNDTRSQWFPQSAVTILTFSDTYSQLFPAPYETSFQSLSVAQSDGAESSSIHSFSARAGQSDLGSDGRDMRWCSAFYALSMSEALLQN